MWEATADAQETWILSHLVVFVVPFLCYTEWHVVLDSLGRINLLSETGLLPCGCSCRCLCSSVCFS
jgi:hypothetical protein